MFLGIYQDKNKGFPIENIFNLQNPLEYKCWIRNYSPSHSYLEIVASKGNDDQEEAYFRIDFSSLLYFDGPFRWKGANFSVETPGECLQLLHKFDELNGLNDETLLGNHILFTASTPNFHIKILAAQAWFSKVEDIKDIC